MAFVTGLCAPASNSVGKSQSTCSQRRSSLLGNRLRSVGVNSAHGSSAFSIAHGYKYSMVYGQTVKEAVTTLKTFPTLVKLAESCGFDLDVKGTFFVPNEAAFARLAPGTVDFLLSNWEAARAVLYYHVVPDKKLSLAKIKGCGFFESVVGGALGYEGLGSVVRVGNALVINESSNNECTDAYIHVVDSVLVPPGVKLPSFNATFVPSVPVYTDSTVQSQYMPIPAKSFTRAREAVVPSTTGGRKAMGLISQLPFYMYGPPFNAAKQEDYEPISIAKPDVAGVDYQVLPPGSVVVEPDSVNAGELNPVSGMSKYIGQTKRIVEGDALSNYSRLD